MTQINFKLTSGLPLGFTLQETSTIGAWSNSVDAVLTTNSPGVSYHYSVPAPDELKLYRVRWP